MVTLRSLQEPVRGKIGWNSICHF